MEKLVEYETAGVVHIWVIDPRLELLSVFAAGNLNKWRGLPQQKVSN